MTQAERLGLWANIPRLTAKRTRERMQFADVQPSAEFVYDLTLLETESEEEASRAASAVMAAALRAGETPR